eukprot:comp15796_c1_seq1/m.13060 comp15796_c1_seq1/g.13060  ORF comp15796_c1_seq1/g.13060 comp15796_c1_seq1/m.13060 type:complete len:279 (-) comp15796_c1_seq1:369-1205(-)
MPGSYLATVGTLIGGHLLMPTLASSRGDEPPVLGYLYFHLTPRELRENFTYSQLNMQRGNWWTALTYMFLHEDEAHLVRNMFGLFIMGHSVHEAFGPLPFLTIYLGGGVVGALDKWTKNHQVTRLLEELFSSSLNLGIISEKWNEFVKKGIPGVVPKINPRFNYVGASAGVFALTGANLCLSIERLFYHLVHKRDPGEGPEAHIPPSLHTAVTLFNIFVLSNNLATELNYVNGGLSWQVDHAGHISGFAFGVGCYFAFRTLGWLGRKLSRLSGRQPTP